MQLSSWFRHASLSFWGGLRDETNQRLQGKEVALTFKMSFFLFVGKREKGCPYSYGLYLQRRAFTDTIVFCEAEKRTLRFYKILVLSREGKKKRPLLVRA